MSYKIEISAEDFLTSVINNTHFRCKKMQCTTSKLTCIARQKSPEIQHQSCRDCEQGKSISRTQGIKITKDKKRWIKPVVKGFGGSKASRMSKNILCCSECGKQAKVYKRGMCPSCYRKFMKFDERRRQRKAAESAAANTK